MGTAVGPSFEVLPHRAAPRVAGLAAPAAMAVLLVASAAALAIDAGEAVDGVVARLLLFPWIGALAFGALGWLVARRDPGNRLAALAAAIAWCFAAAVVLDRYAVLGEPRGWPGVRWVLWAAQWTFVPAMWAIPTVLALRFPDGRLPAPRWRWVERVAVTGILVGSLGWALAPYGRVDHEPALAIDNPVGTEAGVAVFQVGLALWVVGIAGCLAGFGVRTARARGSERARLLWGLVGTVVALAVVAAGAATGQGALSSLGIAVLPAAIAVAIVRHGLWDVEVVVQRSLVYGLLTGAILVVYAGTVALLGGVLGRSVGAPLVATAAVAAGVQPLRDRLQHVANRLLYGEREDPYAALTRLGEQLDAAAGHRTLLEGVADTVRRALRVDGVVVSDGDEVLAAAGATTGSPAVEVPLSAGGERAGTLAVHLRPGDELRPADRRLLAELGRHVAAAVRAERLQREIEASRARLVSAREEERRRIRRDLHDELGPTLAAIAIEAERAGLEVGTDPTVAVARLDDLAERARATVRSVRALVEGLRPASLDELGLPAAVRELARSLGRSGLHVEVATDGDLDSLPAAVEVAAYRIAAEALTNVVRHARADRCEVSLRRDADRLTVTIEDDGCGLDRRRPGGVGLASMAERAAELGGAFDVDDRPGGGTRVRVELPVAAP